MRAGGGDGGLTSRLGDRDRWKIRGQEVPKRAESVNLTSVAHLAKLLAPLKASRVKLRAGMPHADYMESHS